MTLDQILEGCRKHDRTCQYRLHAHFYDYAMCIARRYMGARETAEEVVNDAFYKVFTKIDLCAPEQPFRPWFRRVIINTAIDRLRSRLQQAPTAELQTWHESEGLPSIEEDLTREQIFGMLDKLPPAYRTAFNLFVVDGLSHDEISTMLGISEGSSKSNLARARQHLRKLLSTEIYFNERL